MKGSTVWMSLDRSATEYSDFLVLLRIWSVPHPWSRQTSLSSFYNKFKTSLRLRKTAKGTNDGKPQVLDSVRKYCELIDQKWYYTCVDRNDIPTGGIAHLSFCYHLLEPLYLLFNKNYYVVLLCGSYRVLSSSHSASSCSCFSCLFKKPTSIAWVS